MVYASKACAKMTWAVKSELNSPTIVLVHIIIIIN